MSQRVISMKSLLPRAALLTIAIECALFAGGASARSSTWPSDFVVSAQLHAQQYAANYPEALALFDHRSIDDIFNPVYDYVTSCADDGSAGTLRSVVAAAANGDTIDLFSQLPLACSTITLALGQITVPQIGLTIEGPSDRTLTISSNSSRTFMHTGNGTFELKYLTLSGGSVTATQASGGCVFSEGNVSLFDDVTLYRCGIYATGDNDTAAGVALGGAVYAKGKVTVRASAITYATAYAAGFEKPGTDSTYLYNGFAGGGAVAAGGDITIKYSDINGCRAAAFVYGYSGGGAVLSGNGHTLIIESSTVRNNYSYSGGGIYIDAEGSSTPATINNSTISGNTAYSGAGIFNRASNISIQNSTIAFNRAASLGGGVMSAASFQMQSTIVANNVGGPSTSDDMSGSTAFTVSGNNNLVRVADIRVTLPGDTLNFDPKLGPLQNNGGPTLTHALLPGSPAIDHGNNIGNFKADQRDDPVHYPRVSGATADIGAFEVNGDLIFFDGFD